MPKYTIKGSQELDERIDADMRRIAARIESSPFSEHYRAIVLLGGYGRGEGTPCIVRDREGMSGHIEQLPFNDYDLIVTVDILNNEIRSDLQRMERELTSEIGLPVDLYPYRKATLPRCEFSLLNFELRYGHMVISGDPDALASMPRYKPEELPVSEGTRLLLNRGKLLLDVKRTFNDGQPIAADNRIRSIKFLLKALLAFGDCALLIEGRYDTRYRIKYELISELPLDGLGIREDVIAGYQHAIDFKEWGDFTVLRDLDIGEEFNRIRGMFIEFYRWYETRRLRGEWCDPQQHAELLLRRANECSRVKALAYNLDWLRGRAWRASATQLMSHPRLRLYTALPLLLGENHDPNELARILILPDADYDEGCTEFYAMQRRYS